MDISEPITIAKEKAMPMIRAQLWSRDVGSAQWGLVICDWAEGFPGNIR